MDTNLRIKGILTITVQKDGSRKVYRMTNLLTSFGLAFLASLVVDPTAHDYESYIAVGFGTTAPTEGDTALENEATRGAASRKQLTGAETNIVEFQAVMPRGSVVGDVTEAGIFDDPAGGNMFNRSTFTAIPVAADEALLLNWRIIFQNVTAP